MTSAASQIIIFIRIISCLWEDYVYCMYKYTSIYIMIHSDVMHRLVKYNIIALSYQIHIMLSPRLIKSELYL